MKWDLLFSKTRDCGVAFPLHADSSRLPVSSLLPSSYFQGKRPRTGTSTLTDLQRQECGRVPEADPRLDKKGLSLQGHILQYKKHTYHLLTIPPSGIVLLSPHTSLTARAYLNSTG